MYEHFFNLTELPFNQYPNTDYYYSLEHHQKSLDVLMVGLQVNDGIIKITGEPGTGKSMLCRLFIEKIADHDYPVYIMNPYFTYIELLESIASALKINYKKNNAAHLLKLISDKAATLRESAKKLVLLFDEAQYLSSENLEIVQIIGNLESNGEKLCQIVLIGSLELDDKLKKMDHLLQRVSFSYQLLPISKQDLTHYIFHRIHKATQSGHKHGITLSAQATNLLYKKTRGIPRLINIVCHKALMLAYSQSTRHLDRTLIAKSLVDTEYTSSYFWQRWFSNALERTRRKLSFTKDTFLS